MISTAAPAYPQSNGWLMPGIVLLGLVILLLDYLTPAGYSVSSLYLIPLLLTARSREQRLPPIVAAICTLLVIIGAFVDSRGDVVARAVIFRRAVAISVLWITTVLLVQRMRAEEGWRRHSDDALRRAHDRLRRFVDANIVGVVVESSAGAIIEANDYYLRTIGYTREELEKGLVNWRALTPPEWLTADEHALQELRERGICTPYEKEYVRRDGARVSVFLSDAILPGPEEEIVAFVLDITERKRADEEKQATEERLRLFVEHAPASLAMFDREMRYLSVSRRWLGDYGLGERDLLGLSHYEIFPEIDDRWKAIHKRALAGEVVRDDSDRFDRLDGSVQWLRWEVRPWHDASGKVCGIVVFSEDITERKLAEAEIQALHEDLQRHAAELEQRVRERTVELEAANKDLESFSYSVSHDLRAPLRAINGFARILTEDQGDKLDAEGRRVLGVVCDEASRMGHLIDDLLQFSRLGRKPLQKSVTDMTALVRAIYEELRAQTPERTVDFVLDSLPDVPADPALLRQVWFNLLDNAWKFTRHREHARIVLSGSIQAGEAIYSVADNGAGFDMRYAGKLFGVFQRLHALEEFEGTGVGLALVQQVVRRHGGRVWAEGAVDGGATFSFSLPLSEMPVETSKGE